MADPALTRVKIGVNTKTFKPIWYVEARVNPSRPWSIVTDGKKWITHRTEDAAKREAASLQRRLRAKLGNQLAAQAA